ncbi:hypothetical protein BV902_00920 [Sphingobacterium sp. B29]|uniref:hypothetical protein n=1 Tax=Sphingobacterium sp. B29 TaxID=1933220 RepID=UPI000958442C|nr:hypothetical protein [Sphingobacterium sp. B29]APU95062.1 hypothetical protein BV902_00920 [Sphingobacterium sp. B29]
MKTKKFKEIKPVLSALLFIVIGTTLAVSCSKSDEGSDPVGPPVITAEVDNRTGTVTYHHSAENTLSTLEPGPDGEDVSWDFSQFKSATTTTVTVYGCPGNSNCSDFTAANRLTLTAKGNVDQSFAYSIYTNSEMQRIGVKGISGSTQSKTVYSNPMTVVKYPISYGLSFEDSFEAQSTGILAEKGTFKSTVDAYGTLKTPMGTFNNTLRTKGELKFTTRTAAGTPLVVESVSYTWRSPDHGGTTLLLITFNTINTNGTISRTRSLTYGEVK